MALTQTDPLALVKAINDLQGQVTTLQAGVLSQSLLVSANNTYDIGTDALRFRDIYFSRDLRGGNVQTGSGANLGWAGASQMQAPSNGVITLFNSAGTDFTRLQFGGTTASFPALKRSSTALQVVLADDSDFAPLAAGAATLKGSLKFTTDAAYDLGESGVRARDGYYSGTLYGGGLNAAPAANIGWQTRTQLQSPSDGVLTLGNIGGTGFDRAQFGGTTSSFPAWKRSSAALHARLADDSAFTDVHVQTIYFPGGATPALRSSAAITSGAAAATGTLTNAPVAGNPAKWVPISDNGTTLYVPAWAAA